jgi:N-acetylmuramoyl-L-alanine amidase
VLNRTRAPSSVGSQRFTQRDELRRPSRRVGCVIGARRRALRADERATSDILLCVQRALLTAGVGGFMALTALAGARPSLRTSLQQTQAQATQTQQAAPAQQSAPSQQVAPVPPQIAVPPEAAHFGPMVILDPGHGGTDTGARGANGLTEKEQVLILARMIRSDLERNGFHVVLTRNDDSNPSYEDRAAIANAYRDAIFITLHVSSTGKFGTVRAYSYAFPAVTPLPDDAAVIPAARPAGSIPWE